MHGDKRINGKSSFLRTGAETISPSTRTVTAGYIAKVTGFTGAKSMPAGLTDRLPLDPDTAPGFLRLVPLSR